MGKPTGFKEFPRQTATERAPELRILDWNEFNENPQLRSPLGGGLAREFFESGGFAHDQSSVVSGELSVCQCVSVSVCQCVSVSE